MENPAGDILFVEVWNFKAKKSVMENIVNNNNIKKYKGFVKFLRNIVPENDQQKNEIIGIVQVPLKVK